MKAVFTRCNTTFKVKSIKSFSSRGGGALLNQIYIPNIHHCILWTGNFVVKISLEFWHEKFYPERKIVQDDHVI